MKLFKLASVIFSDDEVKRSRYVFKKIVNNMGHRSNGKSNTDVATNNEVIGDNTNS